MEAEHTARALDGFDVRFSPATGDKEVRARPVSAQAGAGNVKIVRGSWNDEFIRELEHFPMDRHDDSVDALSGAYDVPYGPSSAAWTLADIRAAMAMLTPGESDFAFRLDPDWSAYEADLSTH